jgi:hypothetical protein
LSFYESMIFLIPSPCPDPSPCPGRGLGWGQQPHMMLCYRRLIDDDQAAPWFVMLNEVKHLARVSARLTRPTRNLLQPLIGAVTINHMRT